MDTIPPDKPFKCHPKNFNTTLICILCEAVWHKSDFNKKKGKYITDVFVLCDDHKDIDLDTVDLDKTDNLVIAKIKNDLIALQEENKKIKEKYKKQNEFYKLLKQSYDDLKADKIKKSIENDNSNSNVNDGTTQDTNTQVLFAEYDHIKAINKELIEKNELLKKLNDELDEKNAMLKDKLKGCDEEKQKTYAQVSTLHPNKMTNKAEYVPSLIIKAKNIRDDRRTYYEVANELQNNIVARIKNTFTKKDNSVIVKCLANDLDYVKNKLNERLSENYDITVQTPNNPKVQIVDIEADLNKAELESDINERNFKDHQRPCIVLHTYKNKANKTNIILEVTPDQYQQIRDYRYKIFVGHQCCSVFDEFNLKPCLNCGRFGHNTNKCQNDKTCLICSGNHSTNDCKNQDHKKCVNCSIFNKTYKKNNDTAHTAADVTNCQTIKHKLNTIIVNTNYPLKPTLPKFLVKLVPKGNEGKSHNYKQQYSNQQQNQNQQQQQQFRQQQQHKQYQQQQQQQRYQQQERRQQQVHQNWSTTVYRRNK